MRASLAAEPDTTPPSADYVRVAAAIRYIVHHKTESISLAAIAAAVGATPFQVERLFGRWVGISPMRLKRYLAYGKARTALRSGHPVLDAALAAGLSGPGRLHDLSLSIEAMSPGLVRSGGQGLALTWGCHDSPFGSALIFVTPKGVAGIGFADPGDESHVFEDLRRRWPEAECRRSEDKTAWVAAAIRKASGQVPLHLGGTNLQLNVWEALLAIPPGQTSTYGAIAQAIGKPHAARAVGSAIGANPVAWLIPCHRVLRATGAFGGYRWGLERKSVMLAWEALRSSAEHHDDA